MAVPKLRFKEFDGAWSETLFQDLFIFKNGVNASKEQYGSGIKFINVLDIINNPNGITYDSIIGSVNISSKEIDKNLVKYGDVLFQRSSETREEVGQSNVYLGKDPVVFGGFVIRGSAQKEYNPIFMNGLLKTDYLRDQITQLSGGSTRFNIGQDSLNKVSAYLPSKAEQTKIASFLSNVDEKISQLTQKHELLSQYKQGMMQKLFSQKIRFKADDGSEFGEWKSVFLGDISKPQQWKTISSSELTEIGYPVFGANGYIGFYPKYNHINETIAVTCRGATCGEVTLVKAKSHITGNAMSIDEINENEHSTLYIYYALCFRGFKDVISGSAQPQIVGNAIRKVTFQIPCLEEQTKIANFLSAIDRKIEVVAQQIEQAKQWKKGLLQQMFV